MDLCDIREADIRRWRKERLEAGPRQERPFGPVTVAKAYRLLHAVLNTATDDQLICGSASSPGCGADRWT